MLKESSTENTRVMGLRLKNELTNQLITWSRALNFHEHLLLHSIYVYLTNGKSVNDTEVLIFYCNSTIYSIKWRPHWHIHYLQGWFSMLVLIIRSLDFWKVFKLKFNTWHCFMVSLFSWSRLIWILFSMRQFICSINFEYKRGLLLLLCDLHRHPSLLW